MKTIYIFILLVILSIVSLFTGVHDIGFMDIISGNAETINIMMLTRVPRLVSIITAGMAMSIGGVIMQQISNNKFVSPTTAATMDSAKLGALVSMLLFSSAGLSEKMIVSFAFSLAGTFIFMKILKKVKVKNAIFIPLVGIMVGNVIGSITDFFAYKYNLVQNMSSFLQGDFSMISKGNYELLFVTVPLLIIAFMYANKFTIIGMGEDISKNLGLNFTRISNIGVTLVSLMSALVVITVGSIPFVGLIVPNIVSIFRGDNLSKNIAVTSLFGAVFLLTCDIIGRIIIFPYEVPISLTVGVIGSVVFLYLIFRGK